MDPLPTKADDTREVSSLSETQDHLTQFIASCKKEKDQVGVRCLEITSELLNSVAGDGHTNVQMRLLDNLAAVIKKQVSTGQHASCPWFFKLASTIDLLLWSHPWEPKVMKKILKVLAEMEFYGSAVVQNLISKRGAMLKRRMGRLELNIWSGLLDGSKAARRVVADSLVTLVAVLDQTLSDLLTSTSWTLDRQVLLHMAIKVSLQLIQYLPDEVRHLVWGDSEDVTSSCLFQSFQSLLSHLGHVMSLQSVPKDCPLLAGMAVSFLVALGPISQDSNPAHILHQMMCNLGTNAKVSVGSMNIVFTGPDENQSKAMNTFGHLSLLNGLLACGEESLLWFPVDCRQRVLSPIDDHGDCLSEQPILLWCFKPICDLCLRTDFQYHSFQLLLLWYKKMSALLPKLLSNTGRKRHFCQESVVFQSSLELVWTHLDSPVDGVSECVMELFSQLLLLHQQEIVLEKSRSWDHTKADTSETQNSMTENLNHAFHSDNTGNTVEENCPHGGFEPQTEECAGSATRNLSGGNVEDVCSQVLASFLLVQVMRMSWQVKGKHGLLAVLLKHMGPSQFLLSCPDLWDQLLECMATNYLAPAATDLYKAVVLALGGQKKDADQSKSCDEWHTVCMPHLVKGLASPNSLLRHNISHNWLPWTLRTLPGTFLRLENHLESSLRAAKGDARNHALFAIVAVLRVARGQHLLKSLPIVVVKEALFHLDSEVRQDAFTLLCTTPKKSEPVTEEELSLMYEALPFNMNMDLAPFRQQLQTNIRSLLVRARDSAIAMVKLVAKDENHKMLDHLKRTVDFIDWLWSLCMRSLNPGSSYQRHKSALDWVLAILDTLTYQPNRRQRKGITPEAVIQLVQFAHNQGKWNFFTTDHTQIILVCLLHGTDEIREMAGEVLLQFFPWPLPLVSVTHAGGSVCQLLAHALDLCKSPKAQDCESGALLCKLIFQRHVVEFGEAYTVKWNECGKVEISRDEQLEDREAGSLQFVQLLVSLIWEANSTAQGNVLQAARQAPAHGFILALQRCLTECGLKFESVTLWQPIIVNLIDSVCKLLNLVLHVLGGRLNDDGSAPSFEQMSVAIGEVITESMESGVYEEETVLSTEHQLIMTWCWINIREGCVLLGRLIENLSRLKKCSGVLDLGQIKDIGDTFMKILTKCRHRGAIEGCNLGFMRYCTTLLHSSDPQLHDIPRTLLQQVLSQVCGAGAKVSVTRRSAGLPLIVQSIVASESKTKQHALLTEAVTGLLTVVTRPVLDDPDQLRDLPHIHAINILKAVFRESAVSMALVPYFATVMMNAIEGFSSPYWAIRNASTQLFGTLISRMLGQKKTRDDRLNTMTALEFFAHYPELESFLLSHLQQVCEEQQRARLRLHPSLFPVLSILAKLGSGVQETSSLHEFRDSILLLAGSAIYAVRELAASALVPLVSKMERSSFVKTLVDCIPADRSKSTSFNQIHGTLLQIEKLLESSEHLPSIEQGLLLDKLLDRKWLAAAANPCALVLAKYMEVVRKTAQLAGRPMHADHDLQATMENLFVKNMNDMQLLFAEVGSDRVQRQLVSSYLESKPSSLSECLGCPNVEVVLGSLHHLDTRMTTATDENRDFWVHVQELLFGVVMNPQPWNIHCRTLQLIIDIHSRYHVCSIGNRGGDLMKVLMAMIKQEANCQPSILAIVVTAILLEKLGCEFFGSEVESWCKLIEDCSRPTAAESLRLHAAIALQVAGPVLLEEARKDCSVVLGPVPVGVFWSTLQLLVDDQPLVREAAARFVMKLMQNSKLIQYHSMHGSVALEMFCRFMNVTFPSLAVIVPDMAGHVDFGQSVDNTVRTELCRRRDDLFEPEDINPYMERVVLLDFILSNIQKGLESNPIKLLMCCGATSILGRHIEAVESCGENLHKNCNEHGIFNITCNKRVYEGLYLGLQTIAYCVWILGEHVDTGSAINYITTLSKMPSVHPGLRMLAKQILDQQQESGS